VAATGSGDSLKAGFDVESPQEMADVVPHRLRTQVKLSGDLFGGRPMLQEPKYLRLRRSEMRVWSRWRAGRVDGRSRQPRLGT
jgi:hypothetical protein